MKSILLTLLAISIQFYSNSQYCVSGGPTSTLDSNVESVSISGESATSISHTGCPAVLGVEDLTSQSVILNAGSNYSIDVQFGTCGNNYSGAGEVWIDFNGDQIFDVSESIGQWSGGIPTALSTFNFNVPGTANSGATRMRVMHRESGSIPLDPCGSYTWGSVMDFTVNIGGGIDCSGYQGDDLSDAIEVSSFPYYHAHSSSVCYTSQSNAYPSADVFYLLKIPAGTFGLKATLCGSTFDTYMTVIDTDGNILALNDDYVSCGQNSQVSFNTQNEDSVYLIVEGWDFSNGDYELLIGNEVADLSDNILSEVKIYPNPTNSKAYISGISNYDLKILDGSGKLVVMENNHNSEYIDVSSFQPGLYFVTVQKGGSSRTIKLQVL